MTPRDASAAPYGLFDRERELAMIDRLIDDAAAGNGRLALIEGPAGIGKSRLLKAARERAEAHGRIAVMSARCSELERDFSFGASRQLLESVDADPVPHLRTADEFAPDLGRGDAGQAGGSFAALLALYWTTLELGERQPLLLAIDDIQWSDIPSLRFVDYLAHRIERAPVLLILTLRTDELATDAALIADIATDPLCEIIRPAPLGAAAVARMVTERLGRADPAFLAACEAAAGGNPLLLHHLLTAMEDDGIRPNAVGAARVRQVGSRAIGRTVSSRLRRLSDESSVIAKAVATLGESSSIALVVRLTGLDEASVAREASALAYADILRAERPLGFVHALVRDAIYLDTSVVDRELDHARAARMLREAGADEEEIAAQLLHAPRSGDPETVALLRSAARRALSRGGPESAVAYLSRALEEPPPPSKLALVQFELGRAASDWNAPISVKHLLAAHDQLEDPFKRAVAAGALAKALMFTGGATEAGELACRAAGALPEALDDERQGLQAMGVLSVVFGGDASVALDLVSRYRRLPPNAGLGARCLAAAVAFMWAVGDRPSGDSEALILAALDDGALLESANGLVWSAVTMTLQLSGSPRMAEFADQARSIAYRRGSALTAGSIEQWRGFYLLSVDLCEAGDALRQAVTLQTAWGTDMRSGTWARAYLCRYKLASGEIDEAREALGPAPDEHDLSDGISLWRAAAGEVALAEERWDDALRLAGRVAQAAPHVVNPDWKPWRSVAARALAGLGRREDALKTMHDELEIARRVASAATVGRCLRELGELEQADGADHLREAVAMLAPTHARLELARAFVALGARLRADGEGGDGVLSPLRRGRDLALMGGSVPLVAAAERELRAAGMEDPRAEITIAALTEQELRIARMAAGGRSDRQIGIELLLTPEAVAGRLQRACAKLSVNDREQLFTALAEQFAAALTAG